MLCHWGHCNRTFRSGYRVHTPTHHLGLQAVATRLQATQFNTILGFYSGNRLWTDAVSPPLYCVAANTEFTARPFQNTIEDIYNLMSLKNVNTWKDLIYQTQIGQTGRAHLNTWDLYFGGSFDDAGVGSHFGVYDRRESNKLGYYSGRCSCTSVSEIL